MSKALSGHGVVGEVFRALYHAACDHGGGEHSVRRLLSEPSLVTSFAKTLVGPIWDIIDGEPFELEVDWGTPLSKLGGEEVNVHQNLNPEKFEKRPRALGPFRYSLRYVGEFYPHEIWAAEDRDYRNNESTHVRSATFRELVAFAASGLDYEPHEIVSLGSFKIRRGPGLEEDIIFPRLMKRDGKGEISWTTAEMRGGGMVMSTYGKYFNLVRVHNS